MEASGNHEGPRRSRLRRWLPIALVVLLPVALVLGEALSGGSANRRPAPALPREVLVLPRVTLASLHGQPAVINFWASWCGPCRREAPELARLQMSLRGRARLVGVNWNDSRAGARAFIRRYRWHFANLRDGDGVIGNNYGLPGLPTTFVLEADGGIAAALHGPQTVGSIERALARVSS